MLAQNLMRPEALGISDVEFESLVKVLGMLEREELKHGGGTDKGDRINMGWWYGTSSCGTIGCIAGWAHHISNHRAFPFVGTGSGVDGAANPALYRLFVPFPGGVRDNERMQEILPSQAAIALRNYLTTGEPRWSEALAD